MAHHPEDAARTRLIEAAGEIFAEQGYESATIREICARAGANVAAVNYHFRDKLGLYGAVIRHIAVNPDLPGSVSEDPEKALRGFISAMLGKLVLGGQGRQWHLRIMVHELARPSDGLPIIVEELIGPRYALLRSIISAIVHLPSDHDTVRLSAHSIIGQIAHYIHGRPVLGHVWPAMQFTPEQVEQVAGHIAEFSLAGLRKIAGTSKQ